MRWRRTRCRRGTPRGVWRLRINPREVDHTRQVQRRHLAEALTTNLELLERRQVVEHERGRLAEASVADAERGEDRRRERERGDVR